MSNTGRKKLPTLRESGSTEQLDIFQRDVRKVLRGIHELLADIEERLDVLEAAEGSGGGAVTSVTGTLPITASPATGDVVVSVDLSDIQDSITDLQTQIDGKIDEVIAGTNLSGGGTSGSVTLDVVDSPTFAGDVTIQTLTPGSVLFAGTGGLVSEDNSRLFWDETSNRLGVGKNAPNVTLDVAGAAPNTDILRLQNTSSSGYSAVGFWDSSGTGVKGATGWGNASASDTNVRGKNYWRTLGNNMVYATGTGTPSTTAMMLFDATGNVNIGTTTTDPAHRLRVQGNANVTGTLGVGRAAGAVAVDAQVAGQGNIRIIGNSASPGYTGYIIAKGGGPTELWFIGRDGTGNTDGLIFRRGGATDDLKIDTSGNATFAGNLDVGGDLTANGNVTLGNNTSTDTHTVNGATVLTSTKSSSAFASLQQGTGLTASNSAAVRAINTASYNTTSGALAAFGVYAPISASRSSGSNTLTNIALFGSATGAQVNEALRTDAGDVNLNRTGGTTVIGGGVVDANVQLKASKGSSGAATANSNTVIQAENSTDAWITISGPSATRKGVLFANPSANGDGAIVYDHPSLPRGLQFNTANATQLQIANGGNTTLNVTGGTTTVKGATTIQSTLNATGAVDFDSTLNVDGATTMNSQLTVNAAVVATSGVFPGGASGPKLFANSGDPSGVVLAPQGSLYIRTDVAELWQNTNGGTTWVQL